ncbi:MAG TPA: transglutaminase domain-containing protein [Streptosporangiaceae bacterium]|nr:transglutaminase domain-containing protein [Streptosporangiaceae bacterium]
MQTHEFYTRPGAMTSPGRYAPLLACLPRDIPGLAAIAHGLLIHEHMAAGYGVTLSGEQRESVHVRPVERMLELIMANDGRPLDVAREPTARLPVVCRHFTVLMVAMLRAQGTPARARCGFGGYFTDAFFEDHWVCEYWHPGLQRWALVDAQIDATQLGWFRIDFDVTDVPRDRFLVAGDAWAACRSGAADPATFGLSLVNESGDWWIAGNLMRDAAALGDTEVLPWDCWGAMPREDEPIGQARCALFDRLATLTRAPDGCHTELLRLCQTDEGLRVPATVRNAVRGRDEPLYG